MKRRHTTLLSGLLILLAGCTPQPVSDRPAVTASILPIRFLTEQIAGQDFDINLLVPPGASPETYEPTPKQMQQAAASSMLFTTGLIDFEKQMVSDVSKNMPGLQVVDLSQGIELIEAEHSHTGHGHAHGTDPHIWTSPHNLKIMAGTLYHALSTAYPDSTKYTENYQALIERLDTLDRQLRQLVATGTHHTFIIYHPALAYLARDYGLTQIPIEWEGKEPSAEQIRRVVDAARSDRLRRIFYQAQFSQAAIAAIAREVDAETVAIDPLAENVIDNLKQITQQITE
ncbi:MAG: zinc ABC transporter substrate-binding protein [Rikenellaceae bacterium]|nr:zinc ABC transporter substrate-binding protein [Rikenellaceae bacterium]